MRCPVPNCHTELKGDEDLCPGCGADMRAYVFAVNQPSLVYNRALDLARSGYLEEAARAVQWVLFAKPSDKDAELLYAKIRILQGARRDGRNLLRALAQKHGNEPFSECVKACFEWLRQNPVKRKAVPQDASLQK